MAETTVLKSSASPKIPKPASAKAEATFTGPLPVVKVSMGSGGAPQVASAGQMVKQGVVILPPKNQRRSGVIIGPVGGGGTAAEVLPAFTPDQLLLCRHLVAEYLPAQEGELNAQLAKGTLAALDEELTRAMDRVAAPKPLQPVVVASAGGSRTAAASAPRRVQAPIDVRDEADGAA